MATAIHHRFALQLTTQPQVSWDGGDTFAVRNWQVFRTGYHKGRLYTANDCAQIVENFQHYSIGPTAYIKAKGKIGHDDNQSIAKSLGLPSVGRVTRCVQAADGGLVVDIEGIPCVGIGADGVKYDFRRAVESGAYPDPSIELVWDVPHPDHPEQTIPGAVLEGVAFLGEENPGVIGLPSPQVHFSRDRQLAANVRVIAGRHCPRTRVRFSEVSTVTRDQMLSQLRDAGIDVGDPQIAGMTDDQLQALVKQIAGDGSKQFSAAMKKRYAADPVATQNATTADVDQPTGISTGTGDDLKKMFAKFTEQYQQNREADEKRFGSMEQAIKGMQNMQPEVQQAAKFAKDYEQIKRDDHRKRVTDTVEKAISEGRLEPCDRDDQIELGLGKDHATKFSADAGAGKAGLTAFEAWRQKLLSRPKRENFAEGSIDDGSGDADTSAIEAFVKKADQRLPGNAKLRFPSATAATK